LDAAGGRGIDKVADLSANVALYQKEPVAQPPLLPPPDAEIVMFPVEPESVILLPAVNEETPPPPDAAIVMFPVEPERVILLPAVNEATPVFVIIG
jgi:hypothetical protein